MQSGPVNPEKILDDSFRDTSIRIYENGIAIFIVKTNPFDQPHPHPHPKLTGGIRRDAHRSPAEVVTDDPVLNGVMVLG